MKITIKTLQGKQLPIEVSETDTISKVKTQIEEEHKLEAANMKLIAYGKVMEDDTKSLKDYSIKEGDFLVVMISKAKPPPKAKTEDQKKEETQQQQQPSQQQQQTSSNQSASANVSGSTSAQQQQLPPGSEEAINELISISGKSRDQCIAALRAAFGNADRAFEYLMSGAIPSGGSQANAGFGGGAQEYGEDDYGDEDPSANVGGAGAGGNPLAQLASNPSFAMIRQRILQDPNFYNQFMQQLQTSQPQIYALIQSNPGAFMNLILGGDPSVGLGGGAGAGGHGGMGGGQNPPGSIRVTQEEMDAINRLTQLGFPKHRAAEAYFACDKNEEFAANYLFETGMEDEEAQLQAQLAASTQAQQQPAQSTGNQAAQQQQPPVQQTQEQQQQQQQQQQDQQQQQNQQQQNNNNNDNNQDQNKKNDDDQDGGSSLM